MSSTRPLSISIVIPVFNEEGYLKACLQAIAKQDYAPKEVLVVNNNSTDQSTKIARSFKFVRLLNEKRQGQVFAQTTGFDAASGDILARIDGDTILPPEWTTKVSQAFADQKVVAVTGYGRPYGAVFNRLTGGLFNFYHRRGSCWGAGQVMLWGSNCALRRSAWQNVQPQLHMQTNIWEDFDLSFHLAAYGRLVYRPDLGVKFLFRAAQTPIRRSFKYQVRGIRTVAHHSSTARSWLFAILWSTQVIFIPPLFVAQKVRLLWRKMVNAHR